MHGPLAIEADTFHRNVVDHPSAMTLDSADMRIEAGVTEDGTSRHRRAHEQHRSGARTCWATTFGGVGRVAGPAVMNASLAGPARQDCFPLCD